MTNKEKQYYIYLRSTKQRVPCTKKQFDDYYRDINAYRRTQMNHGRCVCPPSKRLMCDIDCNCCPYHTCGDTSSLDNSYIYDEGNEMNRLDHLQKKMPELQTPSVEDFTIKSVQMREILTRLCEIMPQAIEIGKLRQRGMKDTQIAEEINTPRMTFIYRLKRAREILKKEFPEIFRQNSIFVSIS